jgi:hypothetical protein
VKPAGGRSKAALLPPLLAVLLLAFVFCPRVAANAHLVASFVGVGGALLLWFGVLWLRSRSRGQALAVEVVRPVRQHYIQACVQLVLYGYWGWFWVVDGRRPIFDHAPLLVAQFCFLYAFDGLFAWTRGRPWRLASGPTPIILSTNLFIWFRDDWFVWQFAMIAAGLLGKEFVRWTKDGRRTHIFNPSGFGLACAATVLIVTGTTDLTWAKPLATTIEVQHIFIVIFGLGLVVQHFFAVTLMTLLAALAMVACNVAYTWWTGVYLFGSTNLPAAAFLGLHLLMTDPSTSPRSNLGRALFGLGYGFGYVVAFEALGAIGAPELYAKLYPVPVLNGTVQFLDRLAKRGALGRFNHWWEHVLPARAVNAVHMGIWAVFFVVLFATGYLQGPHPGDSITFWKRAVAEGRHDAERKLVMVAGTHAVARQSGDAYNELGILSLTSDVDRAEAAARLTSAGVWFGEGARRGSSAAVANYVQLFLFQGVRRSDQELAAALQALEGAASRRGGGNDAGRAAYLIGLAYETGGGRPVDPRRALQFYLACPADHLPAQKGIVRLALLGAAKLELGAQVRLLTAAAEAGDGEAAFYLGHLHHEGRGTPRDPNLGARLLQRAKDLGFEPAQAIVDPAAPPPFAAPRRKFLLAPAWASFL